MNEAIDGIASEMGNAVANTLKKFFSGEIRDIAGIWNTATKEVNKGFKKIEERKALEAEQQKQLPDGTKQKDNG